MCSQQITLAGEEARHAEAPFESIHELRRLMGRLADLVFKKHGHDRLRLFDVLLGILAAKIHDEHTRSRPLKSSLSAPDARLRETFHQTLAEALDAIGCSTTAVDIPDDIEVVREALGMLAPFSLRTTVEQQGSGEVLGTFYQEVVSSTFRGSLGAYFTPKPIADLAVAICRPTESDLVLDPSCGSGTFLLSCLEFARRNGGAPEIYGVDIQERMALTASLNAYLHGAPSNIIHGDGLEITLESWQSNAPGARGGFTLIVGNPPFAGHADSQYLPYEANGNGQVNKVIPFVARSVKQLAPGGRAALVLPVSVANAESEAFAGLRRWLAEQVEIEAVLAFTRDAFIHTDCGVEGILLVFRRPEKGSPDHERKAYFREILNLGYDRQGRPIAGSEIPETIAEYHSPAPDNPNFVRLQDLYAMERWDPLWIRNQRILEGAEYNGVPLTDLCQVVKRPVRPSDLKEDKDYTIFELADVDFDSGRIVSTKIMRGAMVKRKNRLRVRAEAGDILLPNHRDSLLAKNGKFVGRAPAIVTQEQAGCITSNRFIVLRPKVAPEVLVYVLNTALIREQLRVLARGSASLDIRDKVLEHVRVPRSVLDKHFVERVAAIQTDLDQSRAALANAEADYRQLLEEATGLR